MANSTCTISPDGVRVQFWKCRSVLNVLFRSDRVQNWSLIVGILSQQEHKSPQIAPASQSPQIL